MLDLCGRGLWPGGCKVDSEGKVLAQDRALGNDPLLAGNDLIGRFTREGTGWEYSYIL